MSNEDKTDEGGGGSSSGGSAGGSGSGGGGGPWGELRRLADEVRVKLHLMNMEVKQRWAAVEPKLQAVQAKVEAKTDQATSAMQTQLLSVVDGLRKLLDDLRADIEGGKKAAPGGDSGGGSDGGGGASDGGASDGGGATGGGASGGGGATDDPDAHHGSG